MTKLTRRSFLALTAAATAADALCAFATPPVPPRENGLSLAGNWRFRLDREDVGLSSGWHTTELATADQIALPGILQTQGYGDEITAETKFVAALPRDMAWYKLPQYAAYTKPGNVKVPYLSQPVRHYLGVAWYQRTLEVPSNWKGKRVVLTLERTRWQTTLFVDERKIGSCQTLVAPHIYDLGLLAPGTHRISIRIDNRMILPYRPDGHSVSDGEGGTWNGIVGRIELSATSPVWLEDVQVYPNVKTQSAEVHIAIGNCTGKAGTGQITLGATRQKVSWDEQGGKTSLTVQLPHAQPWDEFHPELQQLTVKLSGPDVDDSRTVSFGMRELHVEGKQILLNGKLFHMRGTHDGGGFPHTGYPATDVESWRKIIRTCQQWGMNAIRFHSWCPPEAAFIAADELGFYLQPDAGMWNAFDTDLKMLAVLNDETARLLKAYGNHPSMIMLNATNEPAGHYNEQLPLWDRKWREADPRRLYADGTGRAAQADANGHYDADYLVMNRPPNSRKPGRGPGGWFGGDYEDSVGEVTIPVIGHETGQWCAYPDFDVIQKFKGYLVPGNYEIWRDSAQEHHLLALNKAFAHASGRFQVACYKEEIEASLRTPSYSGYQLLDLHDYLGQGGALIGVLDAFWESKGYVEAAEYRQFNSETVVLARLRERVFTTAGTLKASVELAHFGATALPSTGSSWRIEDEKGHVAASGTLPARPIPRGKNIALGTIEVQLAQLKAPAQYRLVLELNTAKPVRNEWKFWLYPKAISAPSSTVLVTGDWSAAAERLAAGGKVLYTAPASIFAGQDTKMTSAPTFWNRLMNPTGAWLLGIHCQHTHPALAHFPTEAAGEWQWIDLAADAYAMKLDTLPAGLRPLVQPIDDWNRNWKLGLVFECRVGQGRLMATSIDLGAARPGTASLQHSLLGYMESAAFTPEIAVEQETLRALFTPVAKPAPARPAEYSPDLDDPGQLKRRPH